MQEYVVFAKKLAYRAGEIMLSYFDAPLAIKEKEDKTIVTIADEEINTLVIKEVEMAYPTHSVFGEEGSVDKKSEYVWVCDPIDGTIPFSQGLPVSVFSLALVRNGEPIVGVVYDPFIKKLYSAVKGGGAYCNNDLIKVSASSLARHSRIDVDWWADAKFDIVPALHQIAIDTKASIVRVSSIAHAACLVASGHFVAAVFPGTKGNNVDIAAVKIIVEEAGGRATDLFGSEQRYDQDIQGAIMSNGVVHEDILRYLREFMS